MARFIRKDDLKNYFKTGAKPTEKHFGQLIDACYNKPKVSQEFQTWTHGNAVTMSNPVKDFKSIVRHGEGTEAVPVLPIIRQRRQEFNRFYHFAMPIPILSDALAMKSIFLDMETSREQVYVQKLTRAKSAQKLDVETKVGSQLRSVKIHSGRQLVKTFNDLTYDGVIPGIELESQNLIEISRGVGITLEIVYFFELLDRITVSVDELMTLQYDERYVTSKFYSVGCRFFTNL